MGGQRAGAALSAVPQCQLLLLSSLLKPSVGEALQKM